MRYIPPSAAAPACVSWRVQRVCCMHVSPTVNTLWFEADFYFSVWALSGKTVIKWISYLFPVILCHILLQPRTRSSLLSGAIVLFIDSQSSLLHLRFPLKTSCLERMHKWKRSHSAAETGTKCWLWVVRILSVDRPIFSSSIEAAGKHTKPSNRPLTIARLTHHT